MRTIAGSEHGNTSNEASGVDTLLVYDHAAKVWVMVHEGNVGFAKNVLTDYVAKKAIQPADLPGQSQADLTTFLADYKKGSNEIRWNLLDNVFL